MREVTERMITNFKIMDLGYDFMGYKVDRKKDLSFHHLIIPRRECKKKSLGEGYLYWNGAILNQNTAHNYLHLIERTDYQLFLLLTSEMIDMNIKGYLDIDNLRYISYCLSQFEKENRCSKSDKGKILIKEDYIKKRIIK